MIPAPVLDRSDLLEWVLEGLGWWVFHDKQLNSYWTPKICIISGVVHIENRQLHFIK